MTLETTKTRASAFSGPVVATESIGFKAVLLLGVAAYLYLNLFVFLKVPVLQGDDQVFFWTNAQRWLFGERVYVDFFQYTPPGADLVFLSLFKLFGPRIWTLNTMVLILGTSLCWVCFRVSYQLVSRNQAVLAALLYLTLIYSKPLNATHHWFSILAIMWAIAVVMPDSSRSRIAVAGGILGLSSFFTQTHGLAAAFGIAAFLIWEQSLSRANWRQILAKPILLLSVFVASVLVLNAHFIMTVGIRTLWYEQVTYVRRYALRLGSIAALGLPVSPTVHSLPLVAQQLFVYLLLPSTYTLSLWKCGNWRLSFLSKESGCRKASLVTLVGLFLLGEVAISPNWLRIYSVAMPAIILLVWCVDQIGKPRRYLIVLLYCGIAILAVRQLWSRHHQPYVVCDLPAGKTATLPQACEDLLWIKQRTNPGDFFFQAAWPGMYVPLGLRNPLYLDALGTNQQTRPEDVDSAIRQLEDRKVRFVLWSQRLDSTVSNHNAGNSIGPFRAYLLAKYAPIREFSNQDELWQRK